MLGIIFGPAAGAILLQHADDISTQCTADSTETESARDRRPLPLYTSYPSKNVRQGSCPSRLLVCCRFFCYRTKGSC